MSVALAWGALTLGVGCVCMSTEGSATILCVQHLQEARTLYPRLPREEVA